MRYARLERWNGDEKLVDMVSAERFIRGTGVSFHCDAKPGETYPERFFRPGYPGCRTCETKTNHVCRQA